MRTEPILRGCMLGLVLLNLAFVQMTGAAGLHWLLPLYVLALASPLLARFREHVTYRIAWNLGIVGLFLVLLRHALRADLAYVLEQGLVLAVFCQVHLLNNLRSNQQPDLLFFNAFLIAIIAAFMSTGPAFPVVFLVFAGVYVVGLQLLSASRGGHVAGADAARTLVLDGVRRAGVTLAFSLLLFLFWPRDFQRKAFFHGRIDFATPSAGDDYEVGFNEEIDLDRSGRVGASDRPALKVTLIDGKTSSVSPLWRGATLGATDGSGWQAFGPMERNAAALADPRWGVEGEQWRRHDLEDTPADVEAEVERLDPGTERLFTPLGTRTLMSMDANAARANSDGTFQTPTPGSARYRISLSPLTKVESLAGTRIAELPRHLAPFVELPDKSRLRIATDLAANVTKDMPADSEQHELVTRLAQHLEQTYDYAPPGAEDAAHSLAEFLRGEAPGHCEFFASALATMLRSLNIPCRVVTGLRSTRWSDRALLFAMRDAHAWIEVHDPGAGWYSVDPSPLYVQGVASESLWARVQTGVRTFWGAITGFDTEKRAEFFAFVRQLPAQVGRGVREQPATWIGGPALVALFLLYRSYRRGSSVPPELRAYRRAVKAAGLTLRAGETPRELLERTRRTAQSTRGFAQLEVATREHEASRYASC